MHERLSHFDEEPEGAGVGSRFYVRAARALRQIDSLCALRLAIGRRELGPEGSMQAFSGVIADLLALSFEAADLAAEPLSSRAIIALASLAQGKELAGQERATAGAAFSRGRVDAACRVRLGQLAAGQERAFQVFRELAQAELVALFTAQAQGADWEEVMRLRARAQDEAAGAPAPEAWYEVATRRIDALREIEDAMAAGLEQLCAEALSQSEAPDLSGQGMRAALLIGDVDPAAEGLDPAGGVGVHALRSLVDVIGAQSRRISDVSSRLDTGGRTLAERRLIERAKGLLMSGHKLTESRAYALMREMAMGQNKPLADIAEAIVAASARPLG